MYQCDLLCFLSLEDRSSTLPTDIYTREEREREGGVVGNSTKPTLGTWEWVELLLSWPPSSLLLLLLLLLLLALTQLLLSFNVESGGLFGVWLPSIATSVFASLFKSFLPSCRANDFLFFFFFLSEILFYYQNQNLSSL